MIKSYKLLFEDHEDVDPYGEEDDWNDFTSEDATIYTILVKLSGWNFNLDFNKEVEILEDSMDKEFKDYVIIDHGHFYGLYKARCEREAVLLLSAIEGDRKIPDKYLEVYQANAPEIRHKVRLLEEEMYGIQDEIKKYQTQNTIEDI